MGGQNTREKGEAGDFDEIELRVLVFAEERKQGLAEYCFGAPESDVGFEPLEVGLEMGADNGVLGVLVKGEEVRMPASDSGPDDPGPGAAEGADTPDGKKEGRDPDVGQGEEELLLILRPDVADKAEGEMHLLWGKPAKAANPRVERSQGSPAGVGKLEADEKALGHGGER
jgi:hypothetical protein